jgi:D-alanine-D-alanine ligase
MFGPEYVIKPVSGGSSIGTKIVSQSNLLRELQASLAESGEVIVEQRIIGKEATVGILENFRNEQYYQLPPIEIVPPAKSIFFSADVKYTGETEEICPGRFSKNEKEELMNTATAVHQALGLRQYSRSDFIVSDDGVYFLEVNTLPGLTAQSLFPKSMEAVGSNYNDLVTHLLSTAS